MPDIWMDVDTALASVPVNKLPLVDDTDFKTIEDAVVYNQAGLALFWNFTTTAGVTTVTAVTPTTAGVYDWTDFTTSGMYGIEIPASGGASINNDTEGVGHFTGVATGILPWTGPTIGFRAAALNNALIDGGDNLDVNLVQWLGTAAATPSVAGVPEIDVTHWNGTAVAAPTTAGVPEVELARISGQTVTAAGAVTINAEVGASATAMDAFEDQYDGTGLSGDTYPASQGQLSGLSVASAAQSVAVKPAPNGFVLTTGSEVNDEDSAVALDGIRHELTDAAGTLDGYYKFDIEISAVPVSLTIKAVVNGGNDTFGIYVNTGSSGTPSWSQRASITGTGTTANSVYEIDLYSSDVLTDIPNEVWIRVYGTGLTTSSFDIDQIFVSRSFNYQYSGYENGAVWIDTVSGTAGTTAGYHGIASRRVDTLADALTIATTVGLDRFHVSNDSTITLASSTTTQEYMGVGWALALGGQDVSNSHFLGANSVTGTSTSATGETHFEDCEFGNASIGNSHLKHCGLGGTLTFVAATDYFLVDCYSQVAGATTPVIDMGAAVGASNLSLRHYSGGITINNLAAGDVISLEGIFGAITLNGADATVEMRGISASVTNNLTGSPTVSDDTIKADDIALILADSNELQTDWANGGRLDLIIDAILAMLDDPRAEPGQGAPAVNADAMTKLDYLYKAWRNKTEQTATTLSIYDDAGTTVDHKSTVSDDATTATKGEIVSGP